MAKATRSLAGQVVAITGGARGIGRATASALIAQGARVAIGDIETTLAEGAAEELGAGTIGLSLDVTDRASFAAFLDEVENRLGTLDVLINNAGIMPIGPFSEEPDSCARKILDINVHGVIFGSKLALERFLPRRRGHIVQIASGAGKLGFAGGVTYCASKHAVVGISEALRAELRGTGIDVTVVMPTVVNTDLGSGLGLTRAFKALEPEEVAEAIIEALQTGRFEVYVPKSMGVTIRSGAVMPRRMMEAIGRMLKSDRVLADPDHVARAAYEARMTETLQRRPSQWRPEATAEQQQPSAEQPEPADEQPEPAGERPAEDTEPEKEAV